MPQPPDVQFLQDQLQRVLLANRARDLYLIKLTADLCVVEPKERAKHLATCGLDNDDLEALLDFGALAHCLLKKRGAHTKAGEAMQKAKDNAMKTFIRNASKKGGV
jgi:hypothetical protein